MANGKPLFKTPEEVKKLAEEYFKKFPRIDEAKTEADKLRAKEYQQAGILPTMSGLCLKLGFYSWSQWQIYENKRLFKATFEGLRLRLLSYWESSLATGRGTQGVTSWINYVTGGSFLGKTQEKQGFSGGVAVVVIGSDGSRQALTDILAAQNTTQIQRVKTIDADAEEVTPNPKKYPNKSAANRRRALSNALKKQEKPQA